eukprot:scaffold21901_cov59-Cyclotella_meneghiniana.AAC.7
MDRWFPNSSEHAETSTTLSMMAGANTVFDPQTQAGLGLGVTDGNSCAVYAAGEELLNRLITSQYPRAQCP